MKIPSLMAAAFCGFAVQSASGQNADAIYHAGSIVTVNDAAPTAGAVAIKAARIPADMVILSDNPLTCDRMAINKIVTLETNQFISEGSSSLRIS